MVHMATCLHPNLSPSRTKQIIGYPIANGIHGILVLTIWTSIFFLFRCLFQQVVLISITSIKLLIMQLIVTNKIMQCNTSKNNVLLSTCKLEMPFKIRHFCFKTPKDRSMTFRRDECKKLNISYFPCGGRPERWRNSRI